MIFTMLKKIFAYSQYKIKPISGLAGLKYIENGKSMSVGSEMLFTKDFDIAIFENSIHNWDPPYENIPVDNSERRRIFNNIVNYFKTHGYGVEAHFVHEIVEYPSKKWWQIFKS